MILKAEVLSLTHPLIKFVRIIMKNAQKLVSFILMILFVTLLSVLLFYPSLLDKLSVGISVFAITIAIIFTIHRNWEDKEHNKLTKSDFVRNTAIDLFGIALAMGTAIWLGRIAGHYAGQNWDMIAGIVAGMAVGFSVALITGKLWGRVGDRLRATAL